MDRTGVIDDDDNDSNGSGILDNCQDPEPIEPVSRYTHPDEIGKDWHPCRDFIDPLTDEIEEWFNTSEREGLDYSGELSTLDCLIFMLDDVVMYGRDSAKAAGWRRALAWFDVHGPAGFGDRLVSRVQAVGDECKSLGHQLENSLPDGDSSNEDDDGYAKDNCEFRYFLTTVVDPFIADLRNWSRELKSQSFQSQSLVVPMDPSRPVTKSKRSTQKGDGRSKLIGALTKHHHYADDGGMNQNPVGNNELARLADVSVSTASTFFSKNFKGYRKYREACKERQLLISMLKLLNQEFSPHLLYGGSPPERVADGDDE